MGVTTSSTVAATYEPLITYTVPSSTTSVTLGTGGTISQAYTDLIVIFNGGLNLFEQIGMRVGNNSVDSGTNYSGIIMGGDGGSTTYSYTDTGMTYAEVLGWAVGVSTTNVTTGIIHLNNYSNTSTYKTFISRTSNPDSGTTMAVSTWRSTSAINIITFSPPNSKTINAGSTFTLFGIKAA